jgi:hypothetical protein
MHSHGAGKTRKTWIYQSSCRKAGAKGQSLTLLIRIARSGKLREQEVDPLRFLLARGLLNGTSSALENCADGQRDGRRKKTTIFHGT